MVKNPPAKAGDAGDTGSNPGVGSPLEEEMTTHSIVLVWKKPWTEESGGLESMELQRVGHDCGRMHMTGLILADTEKD